MLKIMIIAGEPSGDRLAADLIKGLKIICSGKSTPSNDNNLDTHYRQLEFQGIGGPLMESEGFISLFDYKALSVMGLTEVLGRLPRLLKIINQIKQYAIAWEPDVIITVDSPDFCFRVATVIQKTDFQVPIIHYVVPSVWAWRKSRARKMSKIFNHVLSLLPFEKPYMEEVGLSCDFVGHPLAVQALPTQSSIVAVRRYLGIEANKKIFTLLPGSRLSEVKRMLKIYGKLLPVFFSEFPDFDIVIASPNTVGSYVSKWAKKSNFPIKLLNSNDLSVDIYENLKYALFFTSTLALATSGSVSLELARMGTPMVIGYRSSFFFEQVLKKFATIKSATLVNIILNQPIIPEHLFENCKPENLFKSLSSIILNENIATEQRKQNSKVVKLLGYGDKNPSHRAAESILNHLQIKFH